MPGTAKAPEALREAGLFARFSEVGGIDAGTVLAGRYLDNADPVHHRVRNQAALTDHARRLADRVEAILDENRVPLVIGGDCSILLGSGLALRRRGRFGLVHADGHTDFRHPGNSDACASVAGEDLAAAVGLHWPDISDIDSHGPYFRPADVAHVGCRDDDEHLGEADSILGALVTASDITSNMGAALGLITDVVTTTELDGYWLHVDVDILDPRFMPAVDSPDTGGLDPQQFVELLASLAPRASGAQVTVFDPDLDPDGRYAASLTEMLVSGLGALGRARGQHLRRG
ncbi:arginase family protein [Glaciibacter superstes]|uniref:arginase family protein n=1 Tax=Glaciibacter superstes TaxID=501023 RepID=UPI00040A4A0B|nr:arginase family protein [Glaciibacter superstes]